MQNFQGIVFIWTRNWNFQIRVSVPLDFVHRINITNFELIWHLSNIKLYNQPVLICGQPVHTLACMCCCWKLQGFQRLLSTSRVDSDENNFSPVKFYLKFLSKFVFDGWILTVLSFSNLTDFSCIYWAKFKPFWTNIPLM